MAPKKKPKRKPINAKTKATLQKKAANSKYTYGQLAAVYRRGQGAYLSSGSKSASMAAWAMGRVNSFIRGGHCLLYTSPSPRDGLLSRMPSSA